MTRKDYKLIAESIWRAGFVKDKNEIRQTAKEDIRRLIAYDLSSGLKNDNPLFDVRKFFKACGVDCSDV